MFTGIVQTEGAIEAQAPHARGTTFTVSAPDIAPRLSPGDSIAVNGVCQTVEAASATAFTFTAVGETLKRTTFAGLAPGSPVNLETAATLQTALGGHLVQGHVDGVGVIESFEQVGEDRLLAINLPAAIAEFMVEKGSVTVDGVSLTVVEVRSPGVITITIIPFTMEHTIADTYRPGVRVNVEVDIVSKYVRKYVEAFQRANL